MAHFREVTRNDGRVAYEVRWRENGKDRQKTVKNKRAAERECLRIEDELAKGESPEYARRETVADIAAKVIEIDKRKLKQGTAIGNERLYRARILPKWGKRRLTTVTSEEIEKWVWELYKSGLSAATVRHAFIALSKIFRYAGRHRLISVNPCIGVEKPEIKRDHARIQFLQPAQVEAIASELPAPYDLMVRFAAGTGLRAAEIAGLRVGDVNVHKREIRVEQTIKRLDGEWAVDTPKSERSKRTVPILYTPLVKDLAAYLLQHPRSADPNALLWPGRNVGGKYELNYDKPLHHGSFYPWYWRPALVRAGLLGSIAETTEGTWTAGCCEREFFTEVEASRHVAGCVKGGPRFHDLRHTAGSSWLAIGVDMYEVSRWLGHSTIQVTIDIYGHRRHNEIEKYSSAADAYLAAR